MNVEDVAAAPRKGPAVYTELRRERSMSVGIYVLAKGAHDPQRPHTEDELYFVLRGRGRFTCNGSTAPAGPGETFFVPAGAVHRFDDIDTELVLLVVFSPPEGEAARRAPGSGTPTERGPGPDGVAAIGP